MNRYYLSIFDRLGYEVLNPNQAELHLLYKGTNESVEKVPSFEGRSYRDKKNKCRIEWDESHNRYYVYLDEKLYLNFGLDREEEFGNGIFNVHIHENDNTFIHISVGQYPMGNDRQEIARINVTVIDYERGTKYFIIRQRYKDAYLIWTEKMKYKETVEKAINVTDCSFEDYYNHIIDFIDSSIVGQSDNNQSNSRFQKGFYLIDQGLKECLNDLSDYWKNNVLPFVNEEENNNIK